MLFFVMVRKKLQREKVACPLLALMNLFSEL